LFFAASAERALFKVLCLYILSSEFTEQIVTKCDIGRKRLTYEANIYRTWAYVCFKHSSH